MIALEPNPSVFSILKENIFLNSASNITALNIASSDKKGLASLYEPSVKSGKAGTSATLRPDVMSASHGLTYGSSVRVRADTLDNILKDTDAVDLLMIDVEGAEVEVLVGAENLLKKTKMLIVEVRPDTRRKVMELVGKYFVVKELDDHKEWVNLWGTSKN
ncbi:MAG: FkbM family methyltransferase [Candidatus Micrarchaeaceae archaeon]